MGTKHDEPELPTPVTYPQRIFTLVGTSNSPSQRAEYSVSLDDPATFDMFQSAAFSLTAELMAKLGRVFTAAEYAGDLSGAQSAVKELSKSLAD